MNIFAKLFRCKFAVTDADRRQLVDAMNAKYAPKDLLAQAIIELYSWSPKERNRFFDFLRSLKLGYGVYCEVAYQQVPKMPEPIRKIFWELLYCYNSYKCNYITLEQYLDYAK